MECLTFPLLSQLPPPKLPPSSTLWVVQPPMAVYQMVVAVCCQPVVSLSPAVELSIATGSMDMGEEWYIFFTECSVRAISDSSGTSSSLKGLPEFTKLLN